MRYDAEHKRKTRERVLAAAARALRAEGPDRFSVAGVMTRAGLTHGGFYAHFPSRAAFIVEAMGRAFLESGARLAGDARDQDPAGALAAYLDFYLSPPHRDARTSGCPLPFLASDAHRQPPAVRARFAQGAERLRARLAALIARLGADRAAADPDAAASSMLAEMVGAVALARAEPEPAAADAILARSRRALAHRFGLPPAAAGVPLPASPVNQP